MGMFCRFPPNFFPPLPGYLVLRGSAKPVEVVGETCFSQANNAASAVSAARPVLFFLLLTLFGG